MAEPDQTDSAPLELMQLEQPDPVSMLPDTFAWKVLLALLLAAAVVLLWRRYQAHRKALWKRQALDLALEARGLARADPWFALIKRVYLVHHSKVALLDLDDARLLALLPGMNDRVQEALTAGHYQSEGRIPEEENGALYEAFSRWLDELPVVAHVEHKIGEEADV